MMGLQMLGTFDCRAAQGLQGRRSAYPFDPYLDERCTRDASLVEIPTGLRRFALYTLIGDLGQLPPVMDTKWWHKTHSAMGLRGQRLIQSIDVSWSLIGSVRQEGDNSYADLLWRSHEGDFVEEDWRTLNERVEGRLPDAERASFADSMRLYQTKALARASNLSRMAQGYGTRYPRVANVPATHNVALAATFGDEHAAGLQRKGWYAVGAPHMLTSNLLDTRGRNQRIDWRIS